MVTSDTGGRIGANSDGSGAGWTVTISPVLARRIRLHRRALRRQKRTADVDTRERCRIALKSLTELEGDPLRPGLAVRVAMNVRRAIGA